MITPLISLGAACAVLLFTHFPLQAQDSPKAGQAKKRAKTFERTDTNGDGALSKDEFMATPGAKANPEGAAM